MHLPVDWIALHTLFFVKTLYFTWVYQTLGLRLVAGETLTKTCLSGCPVVLLNHRSEEVFEP